MTNDSEFYMMEYHFVYYGNGGAEIILFLSRRDQIKLLCKSKQTYIFLTHSSYNLTEMNF